MDTPAAAVDGTTQRGTKSQSSICSSTRRRTASPATLLPITVSGGTFSVNAGGNLALPALSLTGGTLNLNAPTGLLSLPASLTVSGATLNLVAPAVSSLAELTLTGTSPVLGGSATLTVTAALHAFAACLVVLLCQRLAIRGAWIAGFLFALHPVQVAFDEGQRFGVLGEQGAADVLAVLVVAVGNAGAIKGHGFDGVRRPPARGVVAKEHEAG